MRNTFILLAIGYLVSLGLAYPFVAGMAYVWIDLVKPQALGYDFLNTIPLSFISALVVVLSWAIAKDRKKLQISGIQVLLTMLAIWTTITTLFADPALNSWLKWDPVFKCLLFSAFIPFLFHGRVQVEAFLLTVIFALSTTIFTAGVKTLLGSGGYGVLATLGGQNTGISESSTLAAAAVMILPLMHYMHKHSILFAGVKFFKIGIAGLAVITFAAVVGTAARTGLISVAFLMLLYVTRSRNKTAAILVMMVALAFAGTLNLTDTSWGQRMSTINSYDKDSSAAGRLAVWKWTLKFIGANPLGGGFDAYRLNSIRAVDSAGEIDYFPANYVTGKAFHSIYFEVLGEQGIPGFLMYVTIMILTFLRLMQIRRYAIKADIEWLSDLTLKMQFSQSVLLVGGLFIGIAYQPIMFYLVAATVCLSRFVVKEKFTIRQPVYHAKANRQA